MKQLGQYLLKRLSAFIVLLLCSMIFLLLFFLADVPVYEIGYAFVLCVLVLLGAGGLGFWKYYRKHKQLEQLKQNIQYGLQDLPTATDILEEDYHQFLELLYREKSGLQSQLDRERSEMEDYYAMWVHQIKTPIAAMRLLLQAETYAVDPQIELELFKIEQYVEMVLSYLRIGNGTGDLVIRRQPLDGIVKEAVRKYAKLFIRKKISLRLDDINEEIVTDEKWLVFVIEQILSNSLKYTKKGEIHIYIEKPQQLVIADTGIGIAAEDVPRIFERGFTGYNGREDKKSTGIGLYLCRMIMERLGHGICAESVVGAGTTVKMDLSTVKVEVE